MYNHQSSTRVARSQGKTNLASRSTMTTNWADTNLSRNAIDTSLLSKTSSYVSSSTDTSADSRQSFSNSFVDLNLSDSFNTVSAFRLFMLAIRSVFSQAIESNCLSIYRLASASTASCWPTSKICLRWITSIVLSSTSTLTSNKALFIFVTSSSCFFSCIIDFRDYLYNG